MDLKILQIASNTENNKVIKDYTQKATHKNAICGDQMEISLKVILLQILRNYAKKYVCKTSTMDSNAILQKQNE